MEKQKLMNNLTFNESFSGSVEMSTKNCFQIYATELF